MTTVAVKLSLQTVLTAFLQFVGARRACGAVMLAGARVSSVWAVLAVAAVAAAAVAARQLADTSQGQDLPRCIGKVRPSSYFITLFKLFIIKQR